MVYGCTWERVSIDGEYSGKIFDTDLSVVPGDLYTMALTRPRVTCRRYIKSQWCQWPSAIYTKINLRWWNTTRQKMPRRVYSRCWDISPPGTRYSLTDRSAKKQSRCGLNGALRIWIVRFQNSRQPSVVRIRQVCIDVQAYMAQSCVCMKEVILNTKIC